MNGSLIMNLDFLACALGMLSGHRLGWVETSIPSLIVIE